jgi:hypothetical protein
MSLFGSLVTLQVLTSFPELSALIEYFYFLKIFSSVRTLFYTQPTYICILYYIQPMYIRRLTLHDKHACHLEEFFQKSLLSFQETLGFLGILEFHGSVDCGLARFKGQIIYELVKKYFFVSLSFSVCCQEP